MNEEQEIEYLLKKAGKRTMPTQATKDQLRQSTQAEWRKTVAKEKARRMRFWFAPAAAAAVIVVMLLNSSIGINTEPMSPVQLVSSRGLCEFDSKTQFGSGSVIQSGKSCSLVLNINQNLVVVDELTSLQITGNNKLTLESGRIYVDSESDKSSVIIQTPFGQVTDIGTLFEVAVRNEALQVTLREGIVKVSLPNEVVYAKTQAGQGDQLVVDAQHNIKRTSVKTSSEHWLWAQNNQPPFHLEGKTVDELVHWASRVAGLKVEYLNPSLKQRAQSNTLSGGVVLAESINESLPKYLKTAGLNTQRTETRLIIGEQP